MGKVDKKLQRLLQHASIGFGRAKLNSLFTVYPDLEMRTLCSLLLDELLMAAYCVGEIDAFQETKDALFPREPDRST